MQEAEETKQEVIKYPFGEKRYNAMMNTVFYIHSEALNALANLTHRSGVPKYLWKRIETGFLNKYGLSRYKEKLYVQDELVPLPTGGYRRAGIEKEMLDFLETLDDSFNPDADKRLKFIEKYDTIAKQIQKEHGLTDERISELASDRYDAAGYRRTNSFDALSGGGGTNTAGSVKEEQAGVRGQGEDTGERVQQESGNAEGDENKESLAEGHSQTAEEDGGCAPGICKS